MTPTPEMIAMAEDTANKKCLHFGNADWWRVRDAALTAIMEVSEKAAKLAHNRRCYSVAEILDAIRNGEHLR